MALKRRQPQDRRIERKIIEGMIVSSPFLKSIISIYTQNAFSISYMKTIGDWCIEYYKKFNQAPFRQIQDIFMTHTETLEDEIKDQIAAFLSDLSEEYENGDLSSDKFNVDYYVDQAEKYIELRSLENLDSELRIALTSKRIEDANSLITQYKRPTRIITNAVDIIGDENLIHESLGPEAERDRLFKFHGDLGFLLDWFNRSEFCLIVGSTGKGKSWWLMYIALVAVFSGLNVLFVSLEMTRKQMARRVHSYLSGRPIKKKYAGLNYIPVFDCFKNQMGECTEMTKLKLLDSEEQDLPAFDKAPQEYRPCHLCKGKNTDYEFSSWYKPVNRELLTVEDALRKSEVLKRSKLRGRQFRIIDPPPLSMKASELRTYIDNLAYYENWEPDVVVTDYIDKFAPEDRRMEYRHRIYETTLQHKTLSSERNILVCSGSQSNTSRDEDKDVPSGGLSEDIRKKFEIDKGFSLNQNQDEKRRGIMRIGLMKQRDDFFDTINQCIVLQNLKLGRVSMGSFMPSKYF